MILIPSMFRRPMIFALAAIVFFLLEVNTLAEPVTVRIERLSKPPVLEDFLSGIPSEAGVSLTDFRQYTPGDGTPASQPTTAYVAYDDKNIYVVFVCKDEPGKVRARMAKREDIFSDDFVAVYLDTFRDRQRTYLFGVNPLGIQLDGVYTEGQVPDLSFDTLWYSRGKLTADGYIVGIAIPFKSLRFANRSGQTWGFALGRFIPRTSEFSVWPRMTQKVDGFVQQFATLEGLEKISPGRNLQLIPYGAFTGARFLDTNAAGGPAFQTAHDGRAGLDSKIVLRDALTLDIALNPDFSQVESDEPQVTVNQRFEVFFPEKRPFFIENSGFFQTPIENAAFFQTPIFFQTPASLFFSRQIVDPQFGVRLTGKVNRWAMGGLAIDDRSSGASVSETDGLFGRRAGIGVLTIQREFADQSRIGFLITSRDFGFGSNRVYSLDTRLKLNANWSLSGQAIYSRTQELDGVRLNGPAYFAELRHTGRHLFYSTRYSDRSPNFRSQLGFVPRVDIRQMEHLFRYLWRPERSRVLTVGPSVSGLVNWDRQGRLQDWIASLGMGVELPGLTLLEVKRTEAFELFQDRGFRKNSTTVTFVSDWLRWLMLLSSYEQGTRINFFPAAGLSPFLADSVEARLGLTLRPASQIRLNHTYIYNRLGARRESPVSSATSIFNNHILRTRLSYQFTRALSLRLIVDYNAVLPNNSLVTLERAKRFTGDVLLTYLVNPGTAFYIGYTDLYENLALAPSLPTTLQRIASPTLSTGRQFFVKLSYLFRF